MSGWAGDNGWASESRPGARGADAKGFGQQEPDPQEHGQAGEDVAGAAAGEHAAQGQQDDIVGGKGILDAAGKVQQHRQRHQVSGDLRGNETLRRQRRMLRAGQADRCQPEAAIVEGDAQDRAPDGQHGQHAAEEGIGHQHQQRPHGQH
jgi:hypothetical protein